MNIKDWFKKEKRTLVLGCSLSQGSYKVDSNDALFDDIYSSICWYDYLESFKDKRIDVYALGGNGISTYAHILKELEKTKQISNYDTLIIQETSKRRFNILKKNFMKKLIKSNLKNDVHKDVRNINITQKTQFPSEICVWNYSRDINKDILKNYSSDYELPFKFWLDYLDSPTPLFVEDLAKDYIISTCEKHNIKCFVFSMWEELIDCSQSENFIRLDECSNLYKKIASDKINLSGPNPTKINLPIPGLKHSFRHFSLKGNETLGKLINDKIKKSIS